MKLDATFRASIPLFGVGLLTLMLSLVFCCCLWCLRRQGEREMGYKEAITSWLPMGVRLVKYKKLKKTSNEVCAVCLEEFTPGEKIAMCLCKHSFHRKCLVHWLEQSNTCPLCKQQVRQDSESTRLVL